MAGRLRHDIRVHTGMRAVKHESRRWCPLKVLKRVWMNRSFFGCSTVDRHFHPKTSSRYTLLPRTTKYLEERQTVINVLTYLYLALSTLLYVLQSAYHKRVIKTRCIMGCWNYCSLCYWVT